MSEVDFDDSDLIQSTTESAGLSIASISKDQGDALEVYAPSTTRPSEQSVNAFSCAAQDVVSTTDSHSMVTPFQIVLPNSVITL